MASPPLSEEEEENKLATAKSELKKRLRESRDQELKNHKRIQISRNQWLFAGDQSSEPVPKDGVVEPR